MAEAQLKAVITADDKATPVIKKFGASIGDIAGGVALGSLAVAGLKKGFDLLTGTITSSIRSFNDSAKVTAQLDAVIKSTGGAAGLAREELLGLSAELQRQTTFSDEAVLSAENLLLTFTSIGKDVFPQATKTVLDMSTALGQDTKASAIQLGKALNDPIVGVTALRRVGVQFTESQQDQIKVLVESGQKMQAQKLILAELATEFGGSATAQAQTFEGRLMQMNNQIDDVKEKIGEALVKGLTPFIQKISDFVASPAGQQFADGLTKSIERFFKFLSDNKDTIMAILNGIAFVFKIIGEAISFVFRMITSVGDALGQVLLKIDRFSQKASNVPILGGLFKKIADVLPFAEGGNFSAGQPMLVGERGPELIVPQNSGTVIPNHNMGSNISITFTGPVSMQSDQQIDEIGRRLAKQIELVRQGAL